MLELTVVLETGLVEPGECCSGAGPGQSHWVALSMRKALGLFQCTDSIPDIGCSESVFSPRSQVRPLQSEEGSLELASVAPGFCVTLVEVC